MQSNIYLVIDKTAQLTVGNIIRVKNDEVARRDFHDALNAPNSPFAQHPADYILNKVGTIEEETGIISGQDIPTTIATGKEWLEANKESIK